MHLRAIFGEMTEIVTDIASRLKTVPGFREEQLVAKKHKILLILGEFLHRIEKILLRQGMKN